MRYREILSRRVLRMDLASSVRTSKSRASYFTVRPLHPVNKLIVKYRPNNCFMVELTIFCTPQ